MINYFIVAQTKRNEWIALAMRRNPSVLEVMERMRPISRTPSFSTTISSSEKRFSTLEDLDFAVITEVSQKPQPNAATTEVRETITRESLLQLIYQHFESKNMTASIEAMEKETGIKCTNFLLCILMSLDKRTSTEAPSISNLKCLLKLGISDATRLLSVPERVIRDKQRIRFYDTEVHTASIYNHFVDGIT